ncbi:MAG: glycosyl hydrolase 53 family protein [Marinilabiliaceae bacterium]|nr:glycosyl hydrolase 53 family protein [Marinilabiliaceae bacterium]
MKKKIYQIVGACALLLITACSQTKIEKSSDRLRLNFDEGWKFHLGHAADPSKDFNFKVANIFAKTGKTENTPINTSFDDGDWRDIQLPHDWAVELPFENSPNFDVMAHGYKPVGGLYPQNSVGWYRKSFAIAEADSGKRFSVTFDGIFRDAMVWINGFYLGNNKSGYIGETYDITDYINFKKPNVLVVRVDATQYEGWFYEGAGIYRHVWLNRYNNIHVAHDGVFVQSELNGNEATIVVEAKLENKGLNSGFAKVKFLIVDRSGQLVSGAGWISTSLDVNETPVVKQSLKIPNVRLWNLEDPYLYKVIAQVAVNDTIVDEVINKFGVRTIEIDAQKGLFLNGEHIKIQGTNNHQDHAGIGSALPDAMQYHRIKLLKDLGVNSYRASHNPPTPELLEACDSLGMLVMDETRLLNSSPEYMNQLERLIIRDRNHPSIFMWSIGNEEGFVQRNSYGKRIALTMLAKQKELDPTRTSTYAADLANDFEGINEVIPVRGFNYRVFGLSPYHQDHPTQPIIGTEMGSTVTTRGVYEKDTIRCYVPDQDITAPWWANRAEEWWPLAADSSWMMGGFVWTGFDYRGEPTPYHWPNINSHFGIMDVCGFPKNIYYYYQSWWTDKDVLHISPHWNWKGKEGEMIDVWVNTNADDIELFLNDVSLGKIEMHRNSHLKWQVKYEQGQLKAIAHKGDRILTEVVETTGEPFDLVLMPYKTTMLADGKDATVVNVWTLDKEGREVPTAQNLIKFKLTGDAKIIGVGNGDPSSHEPDKCEDGKWQRSLFNGKCQLIIQSGKTVDKIKLEASTDGVYTASTEIHTIKPLTTLPNVDNANLKKSSGNKDYKMLGADISFLPQLEAKGIKFKENGVEKDAIELLKEHGFNYIRLRLFHNPSTEKGYSPNKGFCDLNHTLKMAKRVKDAGLKLLLDFHYSDYWADPQQQYKPLAWEGLSFEDLKDALKNYTKEVVNALKSQGTTPDMIQIGNEINHGMVWPDGHIENVDQLAQLIKSGIAGVKEVDDSILIMLHVALGGQNDESVFWFNNMFSRGVDCDVIGLSYYPRWHGTLADLEFNMNDLIRRYGKDINLVEYSHRKKEVNDIVFNLPDGKGVGSCIWEPLNTWESICDEQGNVKEIIEIYNQIKETYLAN